MESSIEDQQLIYNNTLFKTLLILKNKNILANKYN